MPTGQAICAGLRNLVVDAPARSFGIWPTIAYVKKMREWEQIDGYQRE
jgi:hypothetical protein